MMIATTNYDNFRRQVLTHEHLDDVSQFYKPGFFDEIPLYSRYRQIEPFIANATSPESVLLDLAVEYLKEITRQAKPRNTFFAAITILDDRQSDQIVPRVFVCHGHVRERMQGLRLRQPASSFGKRMADFLVHLDPNHSFALLEDSETVPQHVRVFIGYRDTLRDVEHVAEQ